MVTRSDLDAILPPVSTEDESIVDALLAKAREGVGKRPIGSRPSLDAIRARCEAASGPAWTWETDDWTTTRRSSVSRIISMDAIRARQESGIETSARLPYLATVYGDADTAFIVHARTDIPALLAYIDELERRTTYTVGETEWAHRIAVAEQRFVDEYDARKAAEREIAELQARIAVLEAMKP